MSARSGEQELFGYQFLDEENKQTCSLLAGYSYLLQG